MDQAIKDAIAASNEAIRVLLHADDIEPGPERDRLIDDAKGEIEEAMDIITTLERIRRQQGGS
jgi:hypothetical protein